MPKRNMKKVKFAAMIGDIIDTMELYTEEDHENNKILRLIFDYDELNDFAKIIIDNVFIDDDVTCIDYNDEFYSLSDEEEVYHGALAFIRAVNTGHSDIFTYEKGADKYIFIFWALMVIAADKTNADKNLSVICDFIQALHITDNEADDIAGIINEIFYYKKTEFKTRTVPKVFRRFLEKRGYAKIENGTDNIGFFTANN